jgi:hypothetical protein
VRLQKAPRETGPTHSLPSWLAAPLRRLGCPNAV